MDVQPLPYNFPITVDELSISNKNLTQTHYLLSLFNATFSQDTYLLSRKIPVVIILLILKPNCDPSFPASYRPIALPSFLGKLFQKIPNKRLRWFFEPNNPLSSFQLWHPKGT